MRRRRPRRQRGLSCALGGSTLAHPEVSATRPPCNFVFFPSVEPLGGGLRSALLWGRWAGHGRGAAGLPHWTSHSVLGPGPAASGDVLAEGGLGPGTGVNVKTALGVRRVERSRGLCGCLVPNRSSVSCMGP